MSRYYPTYLDIKDRLCVVIGAGSVAEGKIKQLLDSGAKVRIISPESTGHVRNLASSGKVDLIERDYSHGDLNGAFIAIAATDNNMVNRQIRDEASAEKVLLNVVDVTNLCDFIAPAIIERGPVSVAISTSGKSPALARKLRESFESEICDCMKWADAAHLLEEVRGEVKGPQSPSPELWQQALDDNLLELIRSGDLSSAKSKLLASLIGGQSEGK
ncbi:MAG: siroheme synthase [Dehalococcoidia bacterium]|nr:siroheme synthase [Dehalococcoidia bacterium]